MPEKIHSVSDITADIRGTLENQFHDLWIEGEISNLRRPGSGHSYFTLKDSFAQLSCVFFKGAAAKNPVELRDGLQVQVKGDISVYEARGQYQLIARKVQAKGAGDLQARFEALKRKLDAEGLFAADRKKEIPAFPGTIGVVTSPTGAAIRDMLQVLGRRAPWIRVVIYPARVQGEGSAAEIAAGVAAFDAGELVPKPDLVIVSRGGGSIEDLWSFNEEVVARAIADCSIPVISGVGHEIDFTIADFVADRREPTPSAAAENATPDGETLHRHLENLSASLDNRVAGHLSHHQRVAEALFRELQAREPGRKIQSWAQSLDFLGERLEGLIEVRLQEMQRELRGSGRLLQTIQPELEWQRAKEESSKAKERLEQVMARNIADRKRAAQGLGQLLHSLSPEATVKRGFSLTLDKEGNPVRSADSLKKGDRLITQLADGEVGSIVE
ncbi:MAG: exodeoxyribonuclease VII large subunit [Verrucomicrobiales bacterium]|nr:exodeoxyribonuclease VII large subunit [Verrucomicrobiales bacterium]